MKFLFGGDWHFRHSAPICRTDVYSDTIVDKLQWLKTQQEKYNVPIVSGGDLMDAALYKSPTDVVLTLKLLEKNICDMVGIVGNHDLVSKNISYLDKSTISVLIASGKYKHIKGFYDLNKNTRLFGFDFGMGGIGHPNKKDIIDGCNIAILHEYVSKKKNDLFGKYVAKNLLKEFPEFDIILTADNHTTFTETHEGRLLINPGSFLRCDADQIKHKPCIFLVDTDNNSYEEIFVPIKNDVISKEHLQIQKDRDKRIESFVLYMDEDYEISDLYEENLKAYILANRVDEKTKEELINMNVEMFIEEALTR